MTNTEKQPIREKLAEFCNIMGSQNKAATSMQISAATVSQILNGNWDLINDEMWCKIEAHLNSTISNNIVDTRGFKLICNLFSDAQKNALVFGLIGDAGSGKTEGIKGCLQRHRNVFHLRCATFWNARHFVTMLLRIIGKNPTSGSIPNMMEDVVEAFKKMKHPQLVIDEADKLSDSLLFFFISLYNDLEGYCSIIVCGSPALEKRILKGCRLNTRGFREFYSRIGRRFIYMPIPNEEDVALICRAQGITEVAVIRSIYDDCDNDLRRVDRKIHAFKIRSKAV